MCSRTRKSCRVQDIASTGIIESEQNSIKSKVYLFHHKTNYFYSFIFLNRAYLKN